MSKKLQLIVPHFQEPVEDMTPLLDSIAIQQSVDFDEVGVIIVCDGPDSSPLPEAEWGEKYPFEIVVKLEPEHVGVSACRNSGLDESKAQYVMFCDADDMFYSVCGLYLIFYQIENEGGFDALISVFIEETRNPQDRDEIVYVPHQDDQTFVHGKVYRRKYLLRNNIRFNDKLTIHEDSYFNILARALAPKALMCTNPFYLWKWRDASVCRHDPDYILKTFPNMLDSNDALVDEFVRRGRPDLARFYTGFMVFDSYYTMNKPDWINQDNQEYRNITERRFASYFAKHRSRWEDLSDEERAQISNGVRTRSVMEGMHMEAMTLTQWLDHISNLAEEQDAV